MEVDLIWPLLWQYGRDLKGLPVGHVVDISNLAGMTTSRSIENSERASSAG